MLEEKSFFPLGSTKPIRVDVRVISASNKNLDQACQEGSFRLDLLYRLKSVHIHLPSLRDRTEDIPLLASHFLKKAAERHHKNTQGFHPEAMDILCRRDYPGNIRELSQLVENAALLTDSDLVYPQHLGETAPAPSPSARHLSTLKENDDAHVAFVLSHTRGDRKEAARVLGITIRQLQRKIAQMKRDPRWTGVLNNR